MNVETRYHRASGLVLPEELNTIFGLHKNAHFCEKFALNNYTNGK